MNLELNQGSIIGALKEVRLFDFKQKKGAELIIAVRNYRGQENLIPVKCFNEVKVSFIQNHIEIGDQILITYTLTANEFNEKFYLTAMLNSIERIPENAKEQFKTKGKKEKPVEKDLTEDFDDDEDLPF